MCYKRKVDCWNSQTPVFEWIHFINVHTCIKYMACQLLGVTTYTYVGYLRICTLSVLSGYFGFTRKVIEKLYFIRLVLFYSVIKVSFECLFYTRYCITLQSGYLSTLIVSSNNNLLPFFWSNGKTCSLNTASLLPTRVLSCTSRGERVTVGPQTYPLWWHEKEGPYASSVEEMLLKKNENKFSLDPDYWKETKTGRWHLRWKWPYHSLSTCTSWKPK